MEVLQECKTFLIFIRNDVVKWKKSLLEVKMRKSIVLILVLFLFIVGCSQGDIAETNETSDFRDVTWGMSKDEVEEVEEAEFISSDEDELMYLVEIGGDEYYLMYNFVDDKLYEAGYLIMDEVADDSYIDLYEKNKSYLTEKYGEPIKDEVIWDEGVAESESDLWFHISKGELTYLAAWENDNTEVFLVLRGHNDNNVLGIDYRSKEYYPLAEDKQDTDILNKL
ncbi:MAG: hypothetical protein ACOX7U_03445 [Desulfitobacteriia bacterium]